MPILDSYLKYRIMETSVEGEEREAKGAQIEDVPHEILEFILSFVPPYKDLQSCMCVSKRWYDCAQNVRRNTASKLLKAITSFKVQWKHEFIDDSMPAITNRYSHAACIANNAMYIFGGCTVDTTSFNDLWCFDLSLRQWIRPITMGTYPVPKAYASMLAHNDILILFGGYTCPSPTPYQNITMFNDVHFYYIKENRWKLVHTENTGPPPTAGHSACIMNNEMVVFGGLISLAENQVACTNYVWVLNLDTLKWRKQETSGSQPFPRYAQSLVLLDDERFLLIGGSQTTQNRFVYSDCWTLTMKGQVWEWNEINVKNKEWGAANIWCNPACRVGDKLVCLSRCKYDWNCAKPLVTSSVRLSVPREETSVEVRLQQSMRRPIDRDQNINGRRGVLPRQAAANHIQQVNLYNQARIEMNRLRHMAEAQDQPGYRAPINNARPIIRENHVQWELAALQQLQNLRDGFLHQDIGAVFNVQQRIRVNFDYGQYQLDNGRAEVRVCANNEAVPGPSNGRPSNGSRPNSLPQRNSRVVNAKIRHLNEANKYRMAAFACDPPPSPPDQRQAPNRMDQLQVPEPPTSPTMAKKFRRNTLTMHVLDIGSVLHNITYDASWLCPRLGQMPGAPDELVMYSFIQGNGELLMFGGVYNDIHIRSGFSNKQAYTDIMYCLTYARDII